MDDDLLDGTEQRKELPQLLFFTQSHRKTSNEKAAVGLCWLGVSSVGSNIQVPQEAGSALQSHP